MLSCFTTQSEKLIVEIKKHVGVLGVEGAALVLKAYYLPYRHSSLVVGTSIVACLADFTTFHYFR